MNSTSYISLSKIFLKTGILNIPLYESELCMVPLFLYRLVTLLIFIWVGTTSYSFILTTGSLILSSTNCAIIEMDFRIFSEMFLASLNKFLLGFPVERQRTPIRWLYGLIFCKKKRKKVNDCKILGLWWTSMSSAQQNTLILIENFYFFCDISFTWI